MPSREETALSETRFRKIEGEVCPGFPLRAMSHADVISGALT
jgi:hypothetical protein